MLLKLFNFSISPTILAEMKNEREVKRVFGISYVFHSLLIRPVTLKHLVGEQMYRNDEKELKMKMEERKIMVEKRVLINESIKTCYTVSMISSHLCFRTFQEGQLRTKKKCAN